MARLFLSYATPDIDFASRLAGHLKLLGHVVWFDQWEIAVGDIIQSRIEVGIDQAEYLIVLLSRHTHASAWVEREMQVKIYEEVVKRRSLVFPALIEDCAIPPFLRPKRVADFRGSYEIGLAQLAIALFSHSSSMPFGSPVPSASSVVMAYDEDMSIKVPQLTELNIEIGLPYIGTVSGVWKPDDQEQLAAWELYVELATRVAMSGLKPNEGLLRESLTSFYTIFTITRAILKKYGPGIARPRAEGELSFGYLALHILNYVLRPILATWHPLLLDYEHSRPTTMSAFEHEHQWEHADQLRNALNETRTILLDYTNILAQVAGVPPLVVQEHLAPAG